MAKLKLKFDDNQEHQISALAQTLSLFDGLVKRDTSFQLGEDFIGNLLPWENLDPTWIEDNLRRSVKNYNDRAKQKGLTEVPNPSKLYLDEGFMLQNVSNNVHAFPKFTIEMETGTGKTYIYLRTIHELRKQFGFRKFLIIVPSRAIYEGTAKSYRMTKEHFKALYNNEVINLTKYSSNKISKLRSFSTSTFTEVLLMTIDAFNKSTNKIFKPTEKLPGEKLPYEYIQETKPILILDESQNYLSKKAKEALRTLSPLFALCYSATPIEKKNLIYRLTPVDAFQYNLVKRIEVLGVTQIDNVNEHQLSFQFKEGASSYGLGIEMSLSVIEKGIARPKQLSLRKSDDLFEKTGNPAYRGLVIDEINRRDNIVIFTNGKEVRLNDPKQSMISKKDIFRSQIEETVRTHMRKQKELNQLGKGIKVLSLFFIDRVHNYVNEDGIVKVLFDEAYNRIKTEYGFFKGWNAEDVREGYFAKKRSKKKEEFIDTSIEKKTVKDKEAEKEAYELIMKNKERLLSFDEKVSFIFAHSALKEGWDNPNVFQICTLNQTLSERKKRQEIGRGLRIPVNQNGERDFDESTNILTVIANESYEDYASGLQAEYRESDDVPPPRPSNARRTPVRRNDKIYKSSAFASFWHKLSQKANYTLFVDTEKLIKECVEQLNNTDIPEPKIQITRGQFIITTYKITLLEVRVKLVHLKIEKSDTQGNTRKDEAWFRKGERLAKKAKDDNLKGFMVVDFVEDGEASVVHFGDAGSLYIGQTIPFSTQKGQDTFEKRIAESTSKYKVPNFIQRAADETHLTKRTLYKILQELNNEKRSKIEINPEAFSTLYVTTIKEALSNHIADNIEYHLSDELSEYKINYMFPKTQKFPQKELLDGADWSLYDHVQYDSEIEKSFVLNKLNLDEEIICYFKFPPKFKIGLPKIIGNYNPDWGIIRKGDNGNINLELVRETKGKINENLLQWPNEARKLKCARRYFQELGIDYRVIDGTEKKWWKQT